MDWSDTEPEREDDTSTDENELCRSTCISKPIDRYGYLSHSINEIDDPLTVTEAIRGDERNEWKQAMIDEMTSLRENNTWILVDRPSQCKTLKAKWIFNKKRAADGTTTRYKARFVAKGCNQKYGIDYNETFSPVVRYSSIRYLMA